MQTNNDISVLPLSNMFSDTVTAVKQYAIENKLNISDSFTEWLAKTVVNDINVELSKLILKKLRVKIKNVITYVRYNPKNNLIHIKHSALLTRCLKYGDITRRALNFTIYCVLRITQLSYLKKLNDFSIFNLECVK